jgi:SSS family solute:Na+ symporter
MAASGIVTDIIANFLKELTHKRTSTFTNSNAPRWNFCDLSFPNAKRLELMLYSYALYGFWIIHPVLGALFWKKSHPIAAFGVCAGGQPQFY